MPTTYYKIHGGRVSVAEYWRMSPNLIAFAIAVGLKPFGGFPFNFSIPRVETLHEVDWDDLPPVAVRQFKEPLQQFEEAGYDYLFAHEMPMLERNRLAVAAILIAKDALGFALVAYVQEPNVRQRHCACISLFDDETIGVTTTATRMLNSSSKYRIQRHVGVRADVLNEHHKEHLANADAEFSIRPVRLDPAAVRRAVLDGEQTVVDFNVERRVFIPMAKAEIRRIRGVRADDD